MELLIKKRESGKFSKIGASVEKGQFGLGHKIQSKNLMKYFITIKQIACNRPLQILASL